jgi:hypothetical protein
MAASVHLSHRDPMEAVMLDAAFCGKIRLCQDLVTLHPQMLKIAHLGGKILKHATAKGHQKIVEWSIKTFSIERKEIRTAFEVAAMFGFSTLCDWFFINASTSIEDKTIERAVKSAAEHGKTAIFEWAQRNTFLMGPELLRTAFLVAAKNGQLVAAVWLVDKIEKESHEKIISSAFFLAAQEGEIPMCEWLLTRVKKNQEDVLKTAFLGAAAREQFPACEWILGSISSPKEEIIKLAIRQAAKLGNIPSFEWLLECIDKDKKTLIREAFVLAACGKHGEFCDWIQINTDAVDMDTVRKAYASN